MNHRRAEAERRPQGQRFGEFATLNFPSPVRRQRRMP